MEYKRLDVEVGRNVFCSVGYVWKDDGDKVTINMEYEGRPIGPLEFFPPVGVANDERAQELVKVWAKWLYEDAKSLAVE